MSTRAILLVLVAGLGACAKRPPADFAPDPGLVARIRSIRIVAPPAACPGRAFATSYDAVLDDGSVIPFSARYDPDQPPRLHVMFLDRSGHAVTAQRDGDWYADPDPTRSAHDGFKLLATLRARPELRAEAAVAPDYSCMPHAFTFEGSPGGRGQSGGDGPDITVRLGIVRSPFYSRLLVAAVEVGGAPPVWVMADAVTVPPADWLRVESRGGDGGRGLDGARGEAGADGTAGCPGSAGGPGGPGGAGGRGAAGGRGGRVTVVAPQEEPFLAGLVDARTPGGEPGAGGKGGAGGAGGKGGAASPAEDRRCVAGANGAAGTVGRAGPPGVEGEPGSRPRVLTVPARDVFGPRVPPEIATLLAR